MDEGEYGDIADEDLMDAMSQDSLDLPPHPRPAKRQRPGVPIEEEQLNRRRPRTRTLNEDAGSEDYCEEEGPRTKKPKYKIHIATHAVAPTKVIGATQADAFPNSSPYRIRGPIFKKPRHETPIPSPPHVESRSSRPEMFRPRVATPPLRPDDYDLELDLEDLPSDAFSSPERSFPAEVAVVIGSSPLPVTQPNQPLVTPTQGLRQTTLLGGLAFNQPPATQSRKTTNYKQDKPPEAPTHHALNQDALQTWVFPTNLGTIRDYQYSIVRNGLFNNVLVALPTGLGKTFIAATIMLNYFRWTKSSQIVFVAPSKPLVAQQVDACFNIVGIPKSQTTMLTGEQAPALRAEEWAEKRVFFMTPQTLQNDLASGIADPKKIVLLVVDEAHRATGNYAYVKVVEFLRRFNKSFRILALTATPGASVEAVQKVIDSLEISKVEIRTEQSLDIQQFVHRRDIDQIVLDPSDEIIQVKELFTKALQPLVNQLCGYGCYWNRDPMALTPYGLMQAMNGWKGSDAGRRADAGRKGVISALVTVLAGVAHSIKLLSFHGIGPFFSAIKDFRQGVEDANKPGKYKSQIVNSPEFKKMMNMIQAWINKDDFIGHPKLTYLCDSVLNHFLDAGEGRHGGDAPPSATRVIVFAEYRDSAEEIVRVLNRHGPMIRASVFVGQQDSKRSEGMNQAKQQEAIRIFKTGKVNVLVATSIGEEGLDIGQVDLIVCYDVSASPIRMLQRMGRTGRKRAGNIVLLLMRGKEENDFVKAKDNYEKMQVLISSGTRFNFRDDLSVRIVPREINPQVDKRLIEIPIENTQGPSIPEPRRRATKPKKKPAKKFHLPDGVETGFRKVSKLGEEGSYLTDFGITLKHQNPTAELVPIPSPASAFLSATAELELERRYQNIMEDETQEVSMPDMTSQTVSQRSLRPFGHVAHGQYTERMVKLFKTLSRSCSEEKRFDLPYGDREPSFSLEPPESISEPEIRTIVPQNKTHVAKKQAAVRRKRAAKPALVVSDLESELDDDEAREGEQEISGDDTEGEGDDLLHSEQPSADDSDIGSLKDFLADGSSQRLLSHDIVRSSTTPPPATHVQTSTAPSLGPLSDDDEEESLSRSDATPRAKPVSKIRAVVDSDDIVVPDRGRREKRNVVYDSDSDE